MRASLSSPLPSLESTCLGTTHGRHHDLPRVILCWLQITSNDKKNSYCSRSAFIASLIAYLLTFAYVLNRSSVHVPTTDYIPHQSEDKNDPVAQNRPVHVCDGRVRS